MVGDMEKMIFVGVVWGATNAIMRRGALLWDQALKSSPKPRPDSTLHQRILISLGNWVKLLSIWHYSIPFLINLSASATFFAILSHAPLSLAVPVTNATTFAATAVFGILLGEHTHLPRAFLVVIDHVVLSDPIQLAHLGRTQLLVYGRSPPICRDIKGTLVSADCSIPLASPCSEIMKSGDEWCAAPVDLNKPSSSCPVVCIP